MGAMNDFFGKPLFQPTGTDWIDHAFTAAVLDDIEQEESGKRSFAFAALTTDRATGRDTDVDAATSRPMTYQEAVDFFVDMAVKHIKQKYEKLGDWWTVYPALSIQYEDTYLWFMHNRRKNIIAFPSAMPLEVLCRIRNIIEAWLKTKCDKHTFIFTDPISLDHMISTTLIHYIPGASNADALAALKSMLSSGQISKWNYQKHIDIIQGTEK